MIPRRPLRPLLAVLLAASASSCAPNVRDLNLPQAVIDNLPKEQALSFLRTLDVPSWDDTCRFDEDGVLRWQKEQVLLEKGGVLRRHEEQVLPGKYPYSSFYAEALRPGYKVQIALFVPGTSKTWCMIAAEENAERHGKEALPFTAKILTALLSMGVRVQSYGEEPVRARK
jgi:hypothetical protein